MMIPIVDCSKIYLSESNYSAVFLFTSNGSDPSKVVAYCHVSGSTMLVPFLKYLTVMSSGFGRTLGRSSCFVLSDL